MTIDTLTLDLVGKDFEFTDINGRRDTGTFGPWNRNALKLHQDLVQCAGRGEYGYKYSFTHSLGPINSSYFRDVRLIITEKSHIPFL